MKWFAMLFGLVKVAVCALLVIHFLGWTVFLVTAAVVLIWNIKWTVTETTTRHGVARTTTFGG